MRLAAAERGLKADDWVTARAGKTLEACRQNAAQTFRQEGDAEEIFRGRIVFGRMAGIDREKIRCELSLLEPVGEHVRMRQSDLDPGSKCLTRLVFDFLFGGEG